jgi:hypothetical protein
MIVPNVGTLSANVGTVDFGKVVVNFRLWAIVPGFHCHSGPKHPISPLECMAGTTGLEPATSAVTVNRKTGTC